MSSGMDGDRAMMNEIQKAVETLQSEAGLMQQEIDDLKNMIVRKDLKIEQIESLAHAAIEKRENQIRALTNKVNALEAYNHVK